MNEQFHLKLLSIETKWTHLPAPRQTCLFYESLITTTVRNWVSLCYLVGQLRQCSLTNSHWLSRNRQYARTCTGNGITILDIRITETFLLKLQSKAGKCAIKLYQNFILRTIINQIFFSLKIQQGEKDVFLFWRVYTGSLLSYFIVLKDVSRH